MQPIPSAAPVLVDLGQEDRFGQSNQGQFLESVRHDIYSKKRQHLKSLTKNIRRPRQTQGGARQGIIHVTLFLNGSQKLH